MVTRFYINDLFDIDLTIHEAFLLTIVGIFVVYIIVVYLIVAVIIRERSIRKYLRERAERRQKLGKVK